MKQYKIYEHPSGEMEAVKQGWSWPGFLFGIIWLFVKKMWVWGAGVLTVLVILTLAFGSEDGNGVGDKILNILALIFGLIFGAQGNSMREKNLLSRGFEEKGVIGAENPDKAKALHLHEVQNAENNEDQTV